MKKRPLSSRNSCSVIPLKNVLSLADLSAHGQRWLLACDGDSIERKCVRGREQGMHHTCYTSRSLTALTRPGTCFTESAGEPDFFRFMSRTLLDNARVHTKAVKERWPVWQERGLFVFFLPTYSPHLNIVEVLWRKLKYEWLRPDDYLLHSY